MNIFKPRRSKFGIRALFFTLLFGVIFTGSGYTILRSTEIDPSWTRVTGSVVDVSASRTTENSTQYAAIIGYTVNGQSYRVIGSSSSSTRPAVGSAAAVAYNPASPAEGKAVVSPVWPVLLYLAQLIGVITFISGPVLFVRAILRSHKIAALQQNGQKLTGVIIDIPTRSNSNRQGGYTIVVAATDSLGVFNNYESDPMTGVAGLSIMDFQNHPVAIDVYVDPVSPSNYYVDISGIPELSPSRIAELIASAGGTKPPQNTISN